MKKEILKLVKQDKKTTTKVEETITYYSECRHKLPFINEQYAIEHEEICSKKNGLVCNKEKETGFICSHFWDSDMIQCNRNLEKEHQRKKEKIEAKKRLALFKCPNGHPISFIEHQRIEDEDDDIIIGCDYESEDIEFDENNEIKKCPYRIVYFKEGMVEKSYY